MEFIIVFLILVTKEANSTPCVPAVGEGSLYEHLVGEAPVAGITETAAELSFLAENFSFSYKLRRKKTGSPFFHTNGQS